MKKQSLQKNYGTTVLNHHNTYHQMNGFELRGEPSDDFAVPRFYKCTTCGVEVPSGIINISGHWGECAGKGMMDAIHKIDKMPLRTEDKMDLVKKQFNIDQ